MTSATMKDYNEKIAQAASPEEYCDLCLKFFNEISRCVISLYKNSDKAEFSALLSTLQKISPMFESLNPGNYPDCNLQDISTILSVEVGDTLLWHMKNRFSEKEVSALMPELISISNEITKEIENLAVWIIPRIN